MLCKDDLKLAPVLFCLELLVTDGVEFVFAELTTPGSVIGGAADTFETFRLLEEFESSPILGGGGGLTFGGLGDGLCADRVLFCELERCNVDF